MKDQAKSSKLPLMSDFDSQLIALIDSARLICDRANKAIWNGEGWTPVIILGHLVDVDQEVWLARFKLMVEAMHKAESAPQLEWWEPDPALTAEKYSVFSLAHMQQDLMASREGVVSYLRALPSTERLASADHRTFGKITIESMLQLILDHDDEHRESLATM